MPPTYKEEHWWPPINKSSQALLFTLIKHTSKCTNKSRQPHDNSSICLKWNTRLKVVLAQGRLQTPFIKQFSVQDTSATLKQRCRLKKNQATNHNLFYCQCLIFKQTLQIKNSREEAQKLFQRQLHLLSASKLIIYHPLSNNLNYFGRHSYSKLLKHIVRVSQVKSNPSSFYICLRHVISSTERTNFKEKNLSCRLKFIDYPDNNSSPAIWDLSKGKERDGIYRNCF